MYIQLRLLLVSLFLFALGFHITGKQSRFTEQIQWPRFEMKGTNTEQIEGLLTACGLAPLAATYSDIPTGFTAIQAYAKAHGYALRQRDIRLFRALFVCDCAAKAGVLNAQILSALQEEVSSASISLLSKDISNLVQIDRKRELGGKTPI
ncbi:uncharacterized protein RSE6_08305 [Rhynchosporium secalis]|uniref:Uncharacterized protein n=1 Tax=Rhynchosporium secalis TaxID=38038 RepID=A0A1E1MF59_RHYSE|nr:uncharacterized protein RSE6_08305 [Rhynchosporium secalis]